LLVQEDLKAGLLCAARSADCKIFYWSQSVFSFFSVPKEVLISADRVCQKEDWKHRHKLICGKHLTVQNIEVTAVPPPDTPYFNAHQGPAPTENIGLAVGGFKRSPALSFQINNLEASSINNVDYIFINPAGRQGSYYTPPFADE
jgi:hypothetical protein